MNPGMMPRVKNAWSTMSCNEGRSCGLGVRICCTSSRASSDTSRCEGNSYWLSRIRLCRVEVKSLMNILANLLIHFFDVFGLEGWPANNESVKDDTD